MPENGADFLFTHGLFGASAVGRRGIGWWDEEPSRLGRNGSSMFPSSPLFHSDNPLHMFEGAVAGTCTLP